MLSGDEVVDRFLARRKFYAGIVLPAPRCWMCRFRRWRRG